MNAAVAKGGQVPADRGRGRGRGRDRGRGKGRGSGRRCPPSPTYGYQIAGDGWLDGWLEVCKE